MASATIEDVAKAAPDVLRWLQMYIFRDQGLTRSLIKRAEDNGYKAIVLTVDAIIHGRRRNDLRNQFILVPHLRFGNVGGPTNKASSEDYAMYVKSLIEQAIDWSAVSWLKSVTKLPVLLKGILTAEDARIAVKHGVDGIIVSNHGGRQLDGVPATVRYYTTPYILLQLINRFGGWTPIRGRVLELCCIDLKSCNSMQNSWLINWKMCIGEVVYYYYCKRTEQTVTGHLPSPSNLLTTELDPRPSIGLRCFHWIAMHILCIISCIISCINSVCL